jgi:hypothetical protein
MAKKDKPPVAPVTLTFAEAAYLNSLPMAERCALAAQISAQGSTTKLIPEKFRNAWNGKTAYP